MSSLDLSSSSSSILTSTARDAARSPSGGATSPPDLHPGGRPSRPRAGLALRRCRQVLPALLLTAAVAPASAAVLLGATRPGNFTYSTDNTAVPLNSAGSTTLSFFNFMPGTYVLTYSAECSADNGSNSNSGWVHLDIQVNGSVVQPTVGTSDAFCSPDNVAGSSGWVRPSISVPVTLTYGYNTVRVFGRFVSPVRTGWLGDSALVVHD